MTAPNAASEPHRIEGPVTENFKDFEVLGWWSGDYGLFNYKGYTYRVEELPDGWFDPEDLPHLKEQQ